MSEPAAIDMTNIPDCPLAPYIAQAWHDVTCPEGPDCRDRLMHSAAQPLAYTGTLAAFLRRLSELDPYRV